MNKTIDEIKAAKEHLEDQISCLLMSFEGGNKVRISDLSIYPREICNDSGEIIARQIGTKITIKI